MKAKQVLAILDISRITLYNYVKKGKIKTITLPNGYYDYNEDDVFKIKKVDKRKNIIYARVSTHKQKKDLDKQIKFITNYCKMHKFKIDDTISDISSGIELDRFNFSKLLDDVLHYKIAKIFISHRDRISRLSFKTLDSIFKKFGTQVIVISEDTVLTDDQEFYNDLVSLMHYFSTKLYSHRRNLYKKTL